MKLDWSDYKALPAAAAYVICAMAAVGCAGSRAASWRASHPASGTAAGATHSEAAAASPEHEAADADAAKDGAAALAATSVEARSISGGSGGSGGSAAHEAPAAVASSDVLTPRQIAERAIPAVALIRLPGGLGSGFVVSADGRIATNLHVIGGARKATVVLADGREFSDVEVLAVDAEHDLALLRVPAKGLPVLKLGDSTQVHSGDRVVAIGHPLGLGNTVSDGLVSAVRDIDASLTVLQVSAPISPGSSGGPLLNDRAEVIGVSTLIFTKGQNLNFGVPIAYLKPMLLVEKGTPLAELSKSAAAPQQRHRAVPVHPIALLKGCNKEQLRLVGRTIANAISVGAPLYNDGNHEACYRVYEGAALELDRKLGACGGPRRALLDGVKHAAHEESYDDKAWAMRDAFDGLLDVIERKLEPGQEP